MCLTDFIDWRYIHSFHSREYRDVKNRKNNSSRDTSNIRDNDNSWDPRNTNNSNIMAITGKKLWTGTSSAPDSTLVL
jgi:hypothetical protein